MKYIFLMYVGIVFIWGTTWIAIKFQTGVVPIENSIFYRFFGAAVLMFLYLLLTKRIYQLSLVDHLFCFLQGLCLFCFNFYLFYIATDLNVETGLLSVVFSMATIFNVINNRFWHKVIPSNNTIIGAIVGILGIVLLFYPDFIKAINSESDSRLMGVMLAVLATFLFSSGNMLSVRHNKKQLPLATTTAWAMLYGSLVMCLISYLYIGSFSIDMSVEYLLSLVYLIIPGSIIAFSLYLTLIIRIGANKTAYTTVLFPIVALSISAVFEGYEFTPLAIIGLSMAILGNIIVFYKPKSKRALEKTKGETHVIVKAKL